jgi:hypothetical protein
MATEAAIAEMKEEKVILEARLEMAKLRNLVAREEESVYRRSRKERPLTSRVIDRALELGGQVLGVAGMSAIFGVCVTLGHAWAKGYLLGLDPHL